MNPPRHTISHITCTTPWSPLSFDHVHVPTAPSVPKPRPHSIDNLDRLLRGRRLIPLWVQKASSHYQWRIHVLALLNNWASGTLSLQGGQIAESVSIIFCCGSSHRVDQHGPGAPARQEGYLPSGRHGPQDPLLLHQIYRGLPDFRFAWCPHQGGPPSPTT